MVHNRRKRTNQEKVEYYQKKLRKYSGLQFSSSSSEDSQSGDFLDQEVLEIPDDIPLVPPNDAPEVYPGGLTPLPDEAQQPALQDNAEVPDLDPDFITALGEVTDDTPKFGEKIHANLASLWLPLLRKGLKKDAKENILKEYPIPENCTLLQAPKLNPEISAAISEMARNRDKKMELAQQHLGIGITAVNRAMTTLLTSDDKVTVIKYLSDSCRILSDLHYCETQTRTKLVTPGLAKPFLSLIQDTERDELLFGNKLPDKIKASKAIEKQSLQIKKPVQATKTISSASTSTAPRTQYQFQGNWMGPSRYQPNRGGRGGPRRAPGNRKPTPNPVSRPAGQGKPRATAPQ